MPLEGENEKKILTLKNIKSNELSLVFSKIVSKGLCCDKVLGISIFPSWTPIRGIYRKSLLKAKKTFIAIIGCCPHNLTERIADFRFVFETHYVKQPPNGLNSFISTVNTLFTSIFVFIVRSVSDYWIDYLY